ncbi:unnamed protein product [Urochloa humidicola]
MDHDRKMNHPRAHRLRRRRRRHDRANREPEPAGTAPSLHGRTSPQRRHPVLTKPHGFSEDPDFFGYVDYAEEEETKDNTPVCELQVRIWSTSPSVIQGLRASLELPVVKIEDGGLKP